MSTSPRAAQAPPAAAPALPADLAAAFEAGGEMGHRIRSFNWEETPLGPFTQWPQSLRTSVVQCLRAPVPLSVSWGPSLTYLYNDAMRFLLGPVHPRALGMPKRRIYGPRWNDFARLHRAVLATGAALEAEEEVSVTRRAGRVQELYCRASYSPLLDEEGRVSGVLTSAVDTTAEAVTRRRLGVLQELARLPGDDQATLGNACARAASIMTGPHADILFALIYLVTGDRRSAVLAGCSGLPPATAVSPLQVELDARRAPWSIRRAATNGASLESPAPARHLRKLRKWPAGGPPSTVVTVPLASEAGRGPDGFLVVGISPVMSSETDRAFFRLLGGQVARLLAASPDSRGPGPSPGPGGALLAAERRRLARDLHDTVLSSLYGMGLGTQRLAELAGDEQQASAAHYVQELTTRALREIRALIFELEPGPLDRRGLLAGLEELATVLQHRESVTLSLRFTEEPDCSPDAKEALIRITQEALTNIVRHAQAASVRLELRPDDRGLCLEITDDGVGFDPAAEGAGHLGLRSMRERADRAGGALEVDTRLGGGTLLRVTIPCE
jgi:signal transduction histidine kinase